MKLILFFFFFIHSIFANEILSQKVEAFLIVGDHANALNLAKENKSLFPNSYEAHEMLLNVFTHVGDEEGIIQTWQEMYAKFPSEAMQHSALEKMALGMLKKGCESDSLITRLIGYLAIAKTELPDSVALIEKGLQDSNATLRSLNVEIASIYGDEPLREILVHLFFHEKHQEVRCQVLKAIETLHMVSLIPQLEANLKKRGITSAEKKQTIRTLSSLKENTGQDELAALIGSGRVWETLLACELMMKWNFKQGCILLKPIVDNGVKEVTLAAIKTLAHFQEGDSELFEKKRFHKDPEIGIAASFALGFLDSSTIDSSFSYWLNHEKSEVRSLAGACLMRYGKKGLSLAKKTLAETDDPLLKANLANHLLQLRVDIEMNGEILFNFLKNTQEKLMWNEGFFPFFQKSDLAHSPLIANLPEAKNQMVRLEILNILSIVEFKKAEEAIREFLKETRWEIAGQASETLLTEGDESAILLVKKLLKDPDPHVQEQAAILLAAWGKDQEAIDKLKELYFTSDRGLKIKILEALGSIGDHETIPFLLDRLNEPSKTIRLISACMLLQVLYH